MEETLKNKRHTLAHLLAASVLEYYPNVKLTLGPSIDNGFYYDVDFEDEKFSDIDLPKIEQKMIELLPSWDKFSHKTISYEDAKETFKSNTYKTELIEEINKKGETITLYTCTNFTDLCRGGHTENPSKEILHDSFCLEKSSWRLLAW